MAVGYGCTAVTTVPTTGGAEPCFWYKKEEGYPGSGVGLVLDPPLSLFVFHRETWTVAGGREMFVKLLLSGGREVKYASVSAPLYEVL